MTTKGIVVFLVVDLLVIIFCLVLGQFNWLLNTQVAFISSVVVTFSSYLGYKKNILKRVEGHENNDDDYDEIDKMDDQYDLYSPDIPKEEISEELTKEQIKEEIKKNKQALKKNNTKNFIGAFGAMTSIYRIGGYALLIIGFFFLRNNGYLEVLSYVAGFLIVPIGALVLNLLMKDQSA